MQGRVRMIGGFKQSVRPYTMLIALVGIWLLFTVLTEGIFLTARNLSNLFLQTSTVAVAAIGMVLIIVTGNIDLSVGSFAAFSGAVAAVLQVKFGWPAIPAFLVTVAVGFLIGSWHGFWIAGKRVPAFIVTLAGMLILRGGVMGITGGATISGLTPGFKAIGQGFLPPLFSDNHRFNDTTIYLAVLCIAVYLFLTFRRRAKRITYGFSVPSLRVEWLKAAAVSTAIGAVASIMVFNRGVPYAVLLVGLLTILFHFVATSTVFGRHLFAIGGNAEAATLSGINRTSCLVWLYVIYGGVTAVAGMVMTARLDAATASAGNALELDVIAATVIGGTSLQGGEGTIFGALVGALIMASLDNGMSLMNLDVTYQYVVKGLILLVAVWVDIATRNK